VVSAEMEREEKGYDCEARQLRLASRTTTSYTKQRLGRAGNGLQGQSASARPLASKSIEELGWQG